MEKIPADKVRDDVGKRNDRHAAQFNNWQKSISPPRTVNQQEPTDWAVKSQFLAVVPALHLRGR
jgi:hypothetical protein